MRLVLGLVVPVLVAAFVPSPAVGYEVAPIPDGGVVKGKVVFQGTVPTKKIIPSKDREVCGDIREEPQIVVGADRGVQEAVVFLKNVEKGKAWAKLAKTPEITNRQCRFLPHVQGVPVGTVVIVNDDPIMHNTHVFLGKTTVFNVALPVKGQRIEKPLKPGLLRVECDTHGWMLAWIFAAANPYYAVTQKDGAFSLSEVPPGTHTLVAWHELTGEVEVPVTVKPKETVQVPIELKR